VNKDNFSLLLNVKGCIFNSVLFFLSLGVLNFSWSTTLRIATYNVLNFPEAMGVQRQFHLFSVLNYIKPDILVLQEVKDRQGFDIFRDSIIARMSSDFSSAPFYDGPDTDNGLFYCADKVEFLSVQYIPAGVRDIAEYRMRFRDSGYEFDVYSVHFKSSQGPENEAERQEQAIRLRRRIDSLPASRYFLVLGDFNIYYSDEPAYQVLLDTVEYRRCIKDPKGISGVWHENSNLAYLHTQSTRLNQLPDGGAGGGLDDRFDMILCSENFLSRSGLFLMIDSYTIFGNDGEHFDLAVNEGYNNTVPGEIADALYYASDHLPIYVEITDEPNQEVAEPVIKIVPNPLKNKGWIHLPWCEDFLSARVTMMNILGQRVFQRKTSNPDGIRITEDELAPGIYFVQVEILTKYVKYHYQTKLAVVE